MNRPSKQNIQINKEILALSGTTDQIHIIVELTDLSILRTTEYTFFSSAHGIFSQKDHMLGTSLNKLKTEIIPSIFSNHNSINWKLTTKKKTGNTKYMEIKQHEKLLGQRVRD